MNEPPSISPKGAPYAQRAAGAEAGKANGGRREITAEQGAGLHSSATAQGKRIAAIALIGISTWLAPTPMDAALSRSQVVHLRLGDEP